MARSVGGVADRQHTFDAIHYESGVFNLLEACTVDIDAIEGHHAQNGIGAPALPLPTDGDVPVTPGRRVGDELDGGSDRAVA